MGYRLGHIFGGGSKGTGDMAELEALYGELEQADEEHFDVWVTHETGWSLAATAGGRVYFERIADEGITVPPPRHLTAVSRQDVLRLWGALSAGDLETLEREPWKPGYK